ncbi:LADA_0B07976g1_1 [Lachancea dasiensis]|uniref:LADA_0B07976g1_1 n=1 Tax=Lachancea dasiensis TaxID=1072105 RepID=A0A1G4IUS0_9SACH|nr:LADA_0B07976g1_1 [Lachancea dasiensis]
MSSFPRASSVSSSVPSTAGTTTENDRRRRDNLNDKIQALLELIPEEMFQDYYGRKDPAELENGQGTPGSIAFGTGSSASGIKMKGTGTKDGKPNKGQILTQAVEYITRLQAQVDARNREEVELILRLKELSKKISLPVNDINLANTSAEIALSKIGVGPLAGVSEDYFNQTESKETYGSLDQG